MTDPLTPTPASKADPNWPLRDRLCADCGEPLIIDGHTDGVVCSHMRGFVHARCCPYSGAVDVER